MSKERKSYIKLLFEMRNNLVSKGDIFGLGDKYYLLDVPEIKNPEYYLFTGREYHIAGVMSEILKHYSDVTIKVGIILRKIGIDLIKILLKSKSVNRFKTIPIKLIEILRSAGYKVGYMHEYDKYPGFLLWEYGFIDDFKVYINNLFNLFEKYKIKKIITISPHSMEILKVISKDFVDNKSNIEVIHYSQLLSKSKNIIHKLCNSVKLAYHDPCHLVRVLNIIEEPRDVIRRCGYEIIEHENSRIMTSCCGAPLESILPNVSREIAKMRLKELSELDVDYVITICPFCLSTFSSVIKEGKPIVLDLIEFLYDKLIKNECR